MNARMRIEKFLSTAEAPASAAVIAASLRLGRSTVTKHLAALEAEGAAVRTEGGREGGTRLPDLWQAPAGTPAREEPEPAPAPEAEATSAPMAPEPTAEATACTVAGEEAALPQDTSAPAPEPELGSASEAASAPAPAPADAVMPAEPEEEPEAAPVPETPATRATGADGRHDPGEEASLPAAAPAGDGAPAMNPISRVPRLQHGQLRLMVKAVLHDSPGEEFSPTEISHLLRGRSVGAIQNALARLVNDGEAELTCPAPRRYRAA